MTTVARRPSAQDIPNTPAGPQGATCQGERGFTLIELSIVLVIIGLLIGGVLQGQEMINNTRLKTTVAQFDGLTAAVQTFQDKYRELPGDAPLAVQTVIGSGVLGNGNGGIANNGAASFDRNLTQGVAEAPTALDHLISANLLTGAVADGANTVYAARLNNTFLDLLTVNDFTDATGALVAPRLAVRVRSDNGAGVPAGGLTPVDAFSIDARYDDGVSNTGRFQSQGGATCAAGAAGLGAYVAGTAQTCISGMLIN